MKILRRLKESSGAAVVETAISSLVLFLALFLGIQLAIAAYKIVALHYVVNTSTRWAVLGKVHCKPTITNCDVNNPDHMMSRLASIEWQVRQNGGPYGFDFQQASFDPDGNQTNISVCVGSAGCSVESAGLSNQLIVITVTEELTLGGTKFPISASQIAKNEPFV